MENEIKNQSPRSKFDVTSPGSGSSTQPKSPAQNEAKTIRKSWPVLDPTSPAPPYTLFIGNLSSNTTTHHVRSFFDSQGIFIRNIRLVKTNKKMGKLYCYIDLPSFDMMRKALKVDGTVVQMLGNDEITVNRSNQETGGAKNKAMRKSSNPVEEKNDDAESVASSKNATTIDGDNKAQHASTETSSAQSRPPSTSGPKKKKKRRRGRGRRKNRDEEGRARKCRTVTTRTIHLLNSILDAQKLARKEKKRGNIEPVWSSVDEKLINDVLWHGGPLPSDLASNFTAHKDFLNYVSNPEDSPDIYPGHPGLEHQQEFHDDWQFRGSPPAEGMVIPPNLPQRGGASVINAAEQHFLRMGEDPTFKNWLPELSPEAAPYDTNVYGRGQPEHCLPEEYGHGCLDVHSALEMQRLSILNALAQLEHVPESMIPNTKSWLCDVLLQNEELTIHSA